MAGVLADAPTSASTISSFIDPPLESALTLESGGARHSPFNTRSEVAYALPPGTLDTCGIW
jgi:hypothetical protein